MKNIFPKSKTFYKIYFTNIIIMVFFIILFSVISILKSGDFIIENIVDFNLEIMKDKGEIFDDKIRQIEEVAGMVTADAETFNFISSMDEYYAAPLQMLDIIGYLNSIASSYSLVDDVIVIDYERDIVLTNTTKMSFSELKLNSVLNKEGLYFQEKDSAIKIIYIKNYNSVYGEKPVSIVLQLNNDAFEENLFLKSSSDFEEFIVAQDGTALSINGVTQLDESIWGDISQSGLRYIKMESDKIAYQSKSKLTPYTVLRIQNYAAITREENRIAGSLMLICFIVIGISSLIIYVFSYKFYKPLRNLSDNISKLDIVKENKKENEYNYIENAVHLLKDEKTKIADKYNKALPVLVQNTCYQLIAEQYEEEAFQYLLNVLNRKMDGSEYALLLMDCSNKGQVRELEETIMNFIKSQAMEAVYADLSASQGIFLINTDLTYDSLVQQLTTWKHATDEFLSVWCLSDYFTNRRNVNLVYFETVNMLERKFFKGNNTFVHYQSEKINTPKQIPNQKTQQKLLDCIKQGKEDDALGVLRQFTQSLSENQEDIQYTCFVYFQICSKLLKAMKDMEIAVPKEYDEKKVFSEMFCAGNLQELKQITEKIVLFCVFSCKKDEKVYSENVESVIEFINKNYSRDLPFEEIAKEVNLSVGYLSSIFKEETGSTVMEYVTHVRMNKAKSLLKEFPNIKVKNLAQNLGYNNVQSFARSFKAYYKITVADYRSKYK